MTTPRHSRRWVLACLASAGLHAAQPAPQDLVPTAKQPFTVPTDAGEKKALVKELNAYMAAPVEQVKAHPAAADFPGVAPAGSPRVSRVVTVHNTLLRVPANAVYAGTPLAWQSTGLYANAGETLTVEPTAPLPAGVTIEVRLGCHTDRLYNDAIKTWKRFPTLSRAFTLKPEGPTPVANAFGGPVFVTRVSGLAPGATVDLRFANAVEAPYFVLGQTTLAQWKVLRDAPAPWGELVGKGMILHFPAAQVRTMDDPTLLLQWWDKVIAAEDDLVGWQPRVAQERVVPDRQISAGGMHSGYPFMSLWYGMASITDLAKLQAGADAVWGFFHELGHNHQSPDWTFAGQTEVTVNFFSLYCMEHICGKPADARHPVYTGAKLLDTLDKRLADPPNMGPFEQLAAFVPLLDKYGWAPLIATLKSYQTEVLAPKLTEPQRQAEFVRRYSRAAKADLGGWFAKLGYAVPEALAAELKALPAFDFAAWRKDYAQRHPT